MPRMFWTCEGTGLPERGVSISLVSTGSKGKCNDVARDNAATPLVPHDGVGQPSSARCGRRASLCPNFPTATRDAILMNNIVALSAIGSRSHALGA